ncbi:MAG: hypothetical protein MZW92_40115 [Comamonadaceae bacterium]|nr:hypothetical protein [Comamonadaceae bacterium]
MGAGSGVDNDRRPGSARPVRRWAGRCAIVRPPPRVLRRPGKMQRLANLPPALRGRPPSAPHGRRPRPGCCRACRGRSHADASLRPHLCRPLQPRRRAGAGPRVRRRARRGRRGARRALSRGARETGCARSARAESDLLIARRPAPRGLPRRAVRHRRRGAGAGGPPPRARAAVRRQAAVRAAPGDERVQAGRGRHVRRTGVARIARGDRRRVVRGQRRRARLRQRRDGVAEGRGAARGGTRPRDRAMPPGRRTRRQAATRIAAACCSAHRASST